MTSLDFESLRSLLLSVPFILSGVIYVVLYVVLTFFVWFGAKDVFRILGAVFFGGYLSTILVWAAESVNAGILFMLSRKLGQDFIQSKFKVKTGQIDRIKKNASYCGVLAVRLNPLIPFRFMDLGYGLTQISLRKYLLIVMLASIPRIFWLQYILEGVGIQFLENPMMVMPFFVNNPVLIKYSMYYLGLVLIITIVAIVLRKWKSKT